MANLKVGRLDLGGWVNGFSYGFMIYGYWVEKLKLFTEG